MTRTSANSPANLFAKHHLTVPSGYWTEFDIQAVSKQRKDGIQLSTVEILEKPWLWDKVIPLMDVTFLVGDPGLGKSTLRDDWIARVTRGDSWPDGSLGYAGGVALVTVEESLEYTVAARLQSAGADMSKVYDFSFPRREVQRMGKPRNSSFLIPDDIDRLDNMILKAEASLVVLDPLAGILNTGRSGATIAQARIIMSMLQAVAKRRGVSILIIGHTYRTNAVDPRQRFGASGGFYDAARSVIFVDKDSDDPYQRLITLEKHNDSPGIPQIAYRINAKRQVEYVTGIDNELDTEHSVSELTTTRGKILSLLNSHPAHMYNITQVANAIQVEAIPVARALQRMANNKEITKSRHGVYQSLPRSARKNP